MQFVFEQLHAFDAVFFKHFVTFPFPFFSVSLFKCFFGTLSKQTRVFHFELTVMNLLVLKISYCRKTNKLLILPFICDIRLHLILIQIRIARFLHWSILWQMSTSLPTSHIFGLGERHQGAMASTEWNRLIFWARDQIPRDHTNLYGVHPFYVGIEADGSSHGVFLLNSNAMEVELQPAPALTWRTIGGELEQNIPCQCFSADS